MPAISHHYRCTTQTPKRCVPQTKHPHADHYIVKTNQRPDPLSFGQPNGWWNISWWEYQDDDNTCLLKYLSIDLSILLQYLSNCNVDCVWRSFTPMCTGQAVTWCFRRSSTVKIPNQESVKRRRHFVIVQFFSWLNSQHEILDHSPWSRSNLIAILKS